MKNKKVKLLIIGFISLLITVVFVIKAYNKPHTNVAKIEPKYSITSQQLIEDFIDNEENANKKYVGEILQVTGRIAEITESTIAIKDKNSESTILCNLTLSKGIENLKEHDKITIKGICTGYLLDVVLVDCIIVN